MTQEEKAKAYDEALLRADEAVQKGCLDKDMFDNIFPPEESEDERIRKALILHLQSFYSNEVVAPGISKEMAIAWLEKQKEQKPNPTEDMPYVADEHFFEREPADTFKYKLAEYMTKCCTKKEGPYGYEYGISAESILKMAKEELIKRGVVQKPVECLKAERDGWYVCIKDFYAGGKKQCSIGDLVQAKGGMYMMGKEDISEWFRRAYYEEVRDAFGPNTDTNIPEQKPAGWSEKDKQWLSEVYFAIDHSMYSDEEKRAMKKYIDSLRPGWKPTEEQMEALNYAIAEWDGGKKLEGLYSLRNDLKKL